MKAVVCQHGQLRVEERPEPKPARGQVLLRVERCGICGSDLHARAHCEPWGALMRRAGLPDFMRPEHEVIFGHEFCGELLEHGPGCKRGVKAGARVAVVPLRRNAAGVVDLLGLSKDAPGAYAERVVCQEVMLEAVPNGLSADLAALTEPMAVALHAVRRAQLKRRDVAIVIGCGPVGLAVIVWLKSLGIRRVIASDYSPGRRRLAERCGADVVIDPAQQSPFANWRELGFLGELTGALELAMKTREQLDRLPLPWWRVWELAERAGLGIKRPVVFECVGVPGIIDGLIASAPIATRVMVVGVCMQPDQLEPAMAINKEIELRFVLGYTPPEFRETLHAIAEGRIDPSPLVTGTVGLDGVETAFDALRDPETHAKILIDPASALRAPKLHAVARPA